MKVSVRIITYNHEPYIAQAIESVLMQKANFDYEVVIGDDCSQDNTRSIIIDFQKRFSSKIRLLLQSKNVGSKRNMTQVINTCRGQYIALLDGDDYWISPDKLQRQVDFLDNNPEFTICFHSAQRLYENGKFELDLPPKRKKSYTLNDIILYNFINTSSVVFRNGIVSEFPRWFYSSKTVGDWPLYILNAHHGKIGYLNHAMSVYRIHCDGMINRLDAINRQKFMIENVKFLNEQLDLKFNKIFIQHLSRNYLNLALAYARVNDREHALKYLSKGLQNGPLYHIVLSRDLVNIIIRLFFPWAVKLFLY